MIIWSRAALVLVGTVGPENTITTHKTSAFPSSPRVPWVFLVVPPSKPLLPPPQPQAAPVTTDCLPFQKAIQMESEHALLLLGCPSLRITSRLIFFYFFLIFCVPFPSFLFMLSHVQLHRCIAPGLTAIHLSNLWVVSRCFGYFE